MKRDLETPQDLSALAWVQDELRRTLETAQKSLRRHARESAALSDSELDAPDPGILRHARVQFHQGAGALDMVGLPVAARVLRACEQAIAKMIAKPREVEMPAVETIERAAHALLDYLARLLADKAVSPLALFPQYSAVQELAGADRSHPADLWPQPWRWESVAGADAVKALAPDADTRGRIEAAVLSMLRGESHGAAAQMSETFAGMGAGANGQLATLWKLAAACFEAQAKGLLDVDTHVQRLASRLLAQVRAISKGKQPEGTERLAQDLLFFCAQARPGAGDAPRLAAARRSFRLPDEAPVDYRRSLLGRFEPTWIPLAKKRVSVLKDSWSALAAGETHQASGLAEQVALVGDSIKRLFDGGETLAQTLVGAVNQAAAAPASPAPELAMEIATALLYIEASLDESELDRPETADRVRHLVGRIAAALQGRPAGAIEGWMEELYRSVSDRQTIGSVVHELRLSLSEVEKQVDRYVRHPGERGMLVAVPSQLAGMRGVLSVLGLDHASQAVLRMRDDVDTIIARSGDAAPGADPTFERLAENLGALGFLIDMLGVQPHLAKSLFHFDAESGRFSSVMGRATKASVHAPLPVPEVTEPADERLAAAPPLLALAPERLPAALQPALPAQPAAPEDDDEDMRAVFFEEAHEVIAGAREAVGVLAEHGDSIGDLTAIRRAFHTLKGSSRMVDLPAIGEAAWAFEQLYNARLADFEPRADAALLGFTSQALDYLSSWVVQLESGQEADHDADQVIAAAEALRAIGQAPAEPPAAPQPDFEPTTLEAPFDAGHLTEKVELPDVTEVAFADTELTHVEPGMLAPLHEPSPPPFSFDFDLDLPALEPDPSFEATQVARLEPIAPPAGADDDPWQVTSIEAVDLEPGPVPGWEPTSIEAISLDEPALPVPTVVDLGELPPAAAGDEAPTEFLGLDLGLDIDIDLDLDLDLTLPDAAVPAGAAEAAPEPVPASPVEDEASWAATDFAEPPELLLPQPADESLPPPELALELQPEAQPEVQPETDLDDDGEPFKVVGPLRVSIPLFNIFLNEADEWSRLLCTATAEWQLETHLPVSDDAIALAHSLAGSSATVGYGELSALARHLEGALARVSARGYGGSDEAALFVRAADEVRTLLHQFAAGFLKPATPELVDQLEGTGRDEFGAPAPPAGSWPEPAFESGVSDAPWPDETLPAIDEALREAAPGAMQSPETAAATPATEAEPAPPETFEPLAAVAAEAPAVEPMASVEWAEPVEATELKEMVESVELVEPVEPVEPVELVEPVEMVEPVDLVEPVELVEPVDMVEPVELVELAEPVEPGGPVEPVQPVELAEPAAVANEALDALIAVKLTPLDEVASEPLEPAVLPPAAAAAEAALPPLGLDELDAVDAVDAQLFPFFEEEAHELVPRLADGMRSWAGQPEERQHGIVCLRLLHTIKGSARLAGALRMGEMAHRLETAVEAALAHGHPSLAVIDQLHAGSDALAHELQRLQEEALAPAAAEPEPEPTAAEPVAAEAPMPEPAPVALASVGDAGRGFDAIDWSRFVAAAREAQPLVEPGAPVRQAAVRVRAALLDRMVTHAGEVSITRARLQADVEQMQAGLKDLSENLERLRRQMRDIELQAESQISSRMEAARSAAQSFDPLELDRFTRFQELTRMMAESVGDVATVQRGLQAAVQSAEDDLAAQARLTRDLQDDLLRSRMTEFDSLSERLYRVVRQSAKECGKQVRLDIEGAAIELDRGVLDRLAGPLEHLLRNAVVHGIEPAEQRTAGGKEGVGLIVIALRHEGNDVEVTVRDDGEGLDLERIRQRAVAVGLLAADAQVGEAELAGMIYRPGFSTAHRVTELAGRGIGMDVVRAEVSAMGGRIETATTPGRGTAFRMLVPLTTAVTQVVLVKSGELTVAVPAALVEVVRRVPTDAVAEAYRSGALADPVGDALPFFRLATLLDDSAPALSVGRTQSVMIVRSAAQRVAVHLDQVVGQQEVVVKHLGRQLSRLPGLTGVSLLPSGDVVLIYNPVALATVYGAAVSHVAAATAAGAPAPQQPAEAAPAEPPAPREPLVMVVDDSLTVRRVTQRLLQREGYRVLLAKDGLDALEKLAVERPVMMLSDIEMPRMDGFDLVRNLRADPALAALPVVMITSRIAQKHRDHAQELGVDHYLGKPYSEDQLLALVRRYAPAAVAV